MFHLNLIVAVAHNGAIGIDNKLPWNIKEDMLLFKKLTYNSTIVMGSKTFESIGSTPLPHRSNVILSRNPKHYALSLKNCIVLHSVQDILSLSLKEKIFIIGGRSIYDIFFQYVEIMYITYIDKTVKSDTFLQIPVQNFNLVDCQKSFSEKEKCSVYYTKWYSKLLKNK